MKRASILLINVAFLVSGFGLVGGCASESASSESVTATQQEIIYGNDDRRDIGQLTDSRQIAWANATGVFYDEADVNCSAGSCALTTRPYGDSQGGVYIPACPGEPFVGQPQGGHCTGFLIAPDLLVTAGHCVVSKYYCEHRPIVFGFMVDASGQAATVVPEEDVYHCSRIVARAVTYDSQDGLNDVDFAVLRLDRPVTGRMPLAIRQTGMVPDDTHFATIGSPLGLPLKYAPGASLRSNVPENSKFALNLDASKGMSGAPVINVDTGVVEGIVSAGPSNEWVTETQADGTTCSRTLRCDDETGCAGPMPWVHAARIESVVEVLEGRSCYDHVLNGQETDVDCGGSDCKPCLMSKICQEDSDCYQFPYDCRRAVCDQNVQCAPDYGSCETQCADGDIDGFETDVDCGGPCAGCGIGQYCILPSDCASKVCRAGTCAATPALGDVNGDGAVNTTDALLVANASVGTVTLAFLETADVNCSGGVDVVDALLIAQLAEGIIDRLPCQ